MQEGKPSETAMRVAMAVVAARRDEALRPLARHADEPYLEWFVSDALGRRASLSRGLDVGGGRARSSRSCASAWRREPASSPLLRKLYVEDEAEAALASGTRQLLVLGAGYDPLALRLCRRYPDLRAFEVDHPATQQVKRSVMEARGAHPANLALVPVDFTAEAADAALAAAGFDQARPSVVVCEGTLMYLAPSEADGVCALAARLGAPGSRFVFTWVDARVLAAGADAAALARALESAGEPLRSSRDPDTLAPFLAGHGFRLAALGDAAALRARYLEPHGIARPLSPLEFAVLAVRE